MRGRFTRLGPVTRYAHWLDGAACLHVDPELFFPVGTTGPALDQIDEAKRVCRGCPVTKRCLAQALETGAASGIWGGTTEDERRAMRIAATRHHRALKKAQAQQ